MEDRESNAVAGVEDTMQWAAAEELSSAGGRYATYPQEVDVKKMGLSARQEFINRIFTIGDDNAAFLKMMTGEVTYNGYKMCEFVHQRTAAYISQHDMHTGEMTVKETLDFSARSQGVGDR
ncbi:hypothetical protein HPP92_024457 [Vanilla planifolia]|uniref:Uncharacterized protein n=1 Tax=Vanilla planifolia TaxID=51239 RepID=A0A835PJP9_VANPL|nr:hypothetical protein HPP92_024457 [Vanilla planifolia]